MMKQILFAGVIGLFLTLIGTPLLIKLLARKGYGQYIRDDGPRGHASKRGTPTMGGIAFILATVAAYFLSKVITGYTPTYSGLLVLGLMVGMGMVGFLDDYIKIVKRRSLGLRAKAKMAGQLIVGIAFAVLALQFVDNRGNTPASTKLSFITDFGWAIGPVLFVLWVLIMVTGTSNGVNLTDGLDGLASGAAILVLAAYVIIGNWQLRNDCTVALTQNCYNVRDPLDAAVVAATVMGACFGFLWWTAPPAKRGRRDSSCGRSRTAPGRQPSFHDHGKKACV
jgi:phospho-N-acetylmuramoyl-pentapeptide-transferase